MSYLRTHTICEDVPNGHVELGPHGSKADQDIDYMAFDRISITVKYLTQRTQYRPKIAIICGSGLGKTQLNLSYVGLLSRKTDN